MASDAPAWLENDQAPPATATTSMPSTMEIAAADNGGNNGSNNNNSARAATTSTMDEQNLPQVILMMRLANMGLAASIMTISIYLIITLPPLSSIVLAVYAVCGGLLVCCLETQLKFLRVMIAVNFGFLFHSLWRFIFYMVLGSVCWSYERLYGQIVGIACVVVAFFNTYVLCRYPAYRQMRERIAQEEDKRIESRISKEVRRQAVNQAVGQAVSGGGNNKNAMSSGI